jgi:hypothetical protein
MNNCPPPTIPIDHAEGDEIEDKIDRGFRSHAENAAGGHRENFDIFLETETAKTGGAGQHITERAICEECDDYPDKHPAYGPAYRFHHQHNEHNSEQDIPPENR